MIKRFYADNYKSLVNFELHLQEQSLLMGASGAGKTSVLDVMFALRQLLSGEAKAADADAFSSRTLTLWQSRDVQVFEIDVLLGEDTLTYRIEIEHDRTFQRARIILEKLSASDEPLFKFENGKVRLYRDKYKQGPMYPANTDESALARVPPQDEGDQRLTRFLVFMRNITVCGLYPASFRAESSRRASVLRRDGSNFASWYQQAVLMRQDLALDLTQALREVIDGFQAINMPPVGQDVVAMEIRFEHDGEAYDVRLDEISDGQRAIIALYAMVRLTAGRDCTLFLDEPENYVALAEIQPWLVELADACGETVPQAVLCSHHPELIDYLGGDRGILLQRETSGVTTARRIDEKPVEGGLKLSEAVARGWER